MPPGWAKEDIIQELLHTAAIAVQREGAMSYSWSSPSTRVQER